MKRPPEGGLMGGLKEVLFVEEDSQFRLCSDPAALFACLKKPIHQSWAIRHQPLTKK